MSKKEKLEFYGFYCFHTYATPYFILIALMIKFLPSGKFVSDFVNSSEGLFLMAIIIITTIVFTNYKKNKFKKELLEELEK